MIQIPRFFLGVAGLGLVIAGSIGINTLPQNTDPLKEIFGNGTGQGTQVSADFITSSISPFDGAISESLFSCMNNQPGGGDEKVYASYNPNANITATREEIKAEIDAVLGHAVNNEQINWTWDEGNQEYTFYTAPGDEKMWKCYFENETDFFTQFFQEDSVRITEEIVKLSLNAVAMESSTAELLQDSWIFTQPLEDMQQIPLGILNIESESEWNNAFLDTITGFQGFSLDTHEILSSTSEAARNTDIPFFQVITESSNELMRDTGRRAIQFLNIAPIPSSFEGMRHFNMSLVVVPSQVPHQTTYQLNINKELFPSFQFQTSTQEYNHSILTSHGQKTALYHEGIEFCPMPDLANPPQGCMWVQTGESRVFPGCIVPNYSLQCE